MGLQFFLLLPAFFVLLLLPLCFFFSSLRSSSPLLSLPFLSWFRYCACWFTWVLSWFSLLICGCSLLLIYSCLGIFIFLFFSSSLSLLHCLPLLLPLPASCSP